MKSCNYKGRQKLFYLQNNQAASCCRSYPVSLNGINSVQEITDLWEEERQQLSRGIEVHNCETCWKDERIGRRSLRQHSDLITVPDTLELFFDNTCNQMCSYCSPKFSSTWQESIEKNGMFLKVSSSTKSNLEINAIDCNYKDWTEKISAYINQRDDNSVNLKLLGGEPLMQLRNLQTMLGLNRKKIAKFEITTNLNPPTPKFLHWLLDTFPKDKLNFIISLDSTPEYNHIPRGKFNSLQFTQNLKLLQYQQINYEFHSVVSVLSLFNLANFVTWAKRDKVIFIKINNPDCLDPVYLPNTFKEKILSGLSNLEIPYFISETLKTTNNSVDLKLFEQYNYLKQYFQRVGIEPYVVNNELFRQYWYWLENFIKDKYENRNRK